MKNALPLRFLSNERVGMTNYYVDEVAYTVMRQLV